MTLAKENNCLFFECSAKTRENVQLIFKELIVKVSIFPSSLRPKKKKNFLLHGRGEMGQFPFV